MVDHLSKTPRVVFSGITTQLHEMYLLEDFFPHPQVLLKLFYVEEAELAGTRTPLVA